MYVLHFFFTRTFQSITSDFEFCLQEKTRISYINSAVRHSLTHRNVVHLYSGGQSYKITTLTLYRRYALRNLNRFRSLLFDSRFQHRCHQSHYIHKRVIGLLSLNSTVSKKNAAGIQLMQLINRQCHICKTILLDRFVVPNCC